MLSITKEKQRYAINRMYKNLKKITNSSHEYTEQDYEFISMHQNKRVKLIQTKYIKWRKD